MAKNFHAARGTTVRTKYWKNLLAVGIYSLSIITAPLLADSIKIEISGLEAELLDNVRASLSAVQAAKNQTDISPLQINHLHKSAVQEIKRALRPFGYYKSSVQSSIKKTGQHWKLQYAVDPGRPVLVAQSRVQLSGAGAEDPQLTIQVKQFPLKQGDPLDQRRYEQFKESLLASAYGAGYLDAAPDTHEIRIDLQQNTADIDLSVSTGPLYLFGPVHFKDSNLKTELLQRYVPFQTGEPFQNSQLLKLLSSLEDSGYFEYVSVVPEKGQAESRHVPVTITLTDRKRQKYTAGAGFGTDTGPRIKLGWEHRRINRRGHKLNLDTQVSSILQSLTGRYRIPIRNPHSDQLEFTTGISRENTDTSKSLLRQLGLSRSVSRGEWRETLGLSFQREDFETDVSNSSTLLIPSVNWTRLRSNSLLKIQKGSRLSLTLKGALASVLSDTSLAQGLAQGKWVNSLGKKSRLLFRTSLGGTYASDFSSVPSSLRFYAGGDQSLRGYGFEELGPVNNDGDIIGGHHLLLASLEFERNLYKKWSAAIFYDTGNAFDGTDLNLKKSAGLGIRWQSPIGPVRLDVAKPLGDINKGYRIHFTLGPDL